MTIEKRMVDEDQQGKVLSVQSIDAAGMQGKTLFNINQYASQAYREAFLDFIVRIYPEFFEDNNEQDQILQSCNAKVENDVKEWINANCQKYEHPCLEFKFNAVDLG